jgi:hypothetical protein
MSPIPEYASGRSLEDIVMRYLEWVPEVKVEATVCGLVTLTGTVYSYAVKATAAEVAKAIPEVRAVTNNIEVQPLFSPIPRDVARAAARFREDETKTA